MNKHKITDTGSYDKQSTNNRISNLHIEQIATETTGMGCRIIFKHTIDLEKFMLSIYFMRILAVNHLFLLSK